MIQVLLDSFRNSGPEYLTPLSDDHYTLAVCHTGASGSTRHVSEARLLNMSVYGATVAICLLRGISPKPLSPVLLFYIIHGCDLNSIDPAILGEWCPSLKATISEWVQIGPQGDVTPFQGHFSSYHNYQVGGLTITHIFI